MPCAQSSDRPVDSSSPRQMRAWLIMGNGPNGSMGTGNLGAWRVDSHMACWFQYPKPTRDALSYAVWSPAALVLWLETKHVYVWFRQVRCSCRFSGILEVVQVQSRLTWISVESVCTEARFETRCMSFATASHRSASHRSAHLETSRGIWNLD